MLRHPGDGVNCLLYASPFAPVCHSPLPYVFRRTNFPILAVAHRDGRTELALDERRLNRRDLEGRICGDEYCRHDDFAARPTLALSRSC